MFKLCQPDPTKQLEKQHRRKLEEARNARRASNRPSIVALTLDAKDLSHRLDVLKQCA